MRFDLARKKTFYLSLFALYAIFVVAALGVQLYLDYQLKSHIGEVLSTNGRSHLIVRSLRRLEEMSLYHVEGLKTFSSAKIASPLVLGAETIRFGSEDSSWLWQQCLSHVVYFDQERKTSLGEFSYCYDRFGEIGAVLAACVVVLIPLLPLAERYRRGLGRALLQEREAALGRVTRQISHDLRGPLGMIERLLALPPESKLEELRPAIQSSFYRLQGMISAVLKVDDELLVRPVPSNFSWELAFSALEARAVRQGKNLLKPEQTWNTPVRIDPIKFERAWMNLVSNAIDAAQSSVHLRFLREAGELVVQVEDDGPGVSPDLLPRLFQRGLSGGKLEGTGLGLAYVREVMRGHGGDVSYSRCKSQSLFECRIPDTDALPSSDADRPPKAPRSRRLVAICLDPPELSERIHSRFAAQSSLDCAWLRDPQGAEVLVSNIDQLLFSALDDEQVEVIQIGRNLSEASIFELLVRRLSLSNS